MKKVINLFTHTDLDGVACSVLIHLYFRDRNAITVQYCDYSNIDQKLNDFMDTIELAERQHALPDVERIIYITDISMSPFTASRLDAFCVWRNIEVHMIDHHQVDPVITHLPWVHVDSRPFVCGASLLYTHLQQDLDSMIPGATVYFVEDVRRYDTWEFDKDTESNPDNLNTLLKLIGRDRFELLVTNHHIVNPGRKFYVCMLDDLYAAVEGENAFRKEYMAQRNNHVRKFLYKGYIFGVVFAEQHISRVGDYVLKKNPDIDICAIVNLPTSVSLRTMRDDINLGVDIARPLGGGGHKKAAAFHLKTPPIDLVLDLIGMKEEQE